MSTKNNCYMIAVKKTCGALGHRYVCSSCFHGLISLLKRCPIN